MNEYKRDLRQKSIYNMTIFSRAYSKGNERIKLDQMGPEWTKGLNRTKPNWTK